MVEIPEYRRWDGTKAVCVPRAWSRAEIEAHVNAGHAPDLFVGRWKVSRRRKLTPFVPLPDSCPDDCARVHHLMEPVPPAPLGGTDDAG